MVGFTMILLQKWGNIPWNSSNHYVISTVTNMPKIW